MSKICFLCGENETPEGSVSHNICDRCFDNAGDYIETNIYMIRALPYLLEACYAALELKCPDGDDHECGVLDSINEAIDIAEGKKAPILCTEG